MSTIERLIEWRGYGSPVIHNRSPTKFARDVIELMQQHQEMLEALKRFMNHRLAVFDAQMRNKLDSIPSGRIDEIIDQMRAAIARAEGRT